MLGSIEPGSIGVGEKRVKGGNPLIVLSNSGCEIRSAQQFFVRRYHTLSQNITLGRNLAAMRGPRQGQRRFRIASSILTRHVAAAKWLGRRNARECPSPSGGVCGMTAKQVALSPSGSKNFPKSPTARGGVETEQSGIRALLPQHASKCPKVSREGWERGANDARWGLDAWMASSSEEFQRLSHRKPELVCARGGEHQCTLGRSHPNITLTNTELQEEYYGFFERLFDGTRCPTPDHSSFARVETAPATESTINKIPSPIAGIIQR
jgi:hypothetical protein